MISLSLRYEFRDIGVREMDARCRGEALNLNVDEGKGA
jgi:hypothetical protein